MNMTEARALCEGLGIRPARSLAETLERIKAHEFVHLSGGFVEEGSPTGHVPLPTEGLQVVMHPEDARHFIVDYEPAPVDFFDGIEAGKTPKRRDTKGFDNRLQRKAMRKATRKQQRKGR